MGLHFLLQHLDRPGTYVRILFVDFSSAFNTIIQDTLQNKLTQLSVPTSVCQWITSFLTDRQQVVRLGKLSSSTRTISTGAPKGCVLSPLLFSLYTNDCTSKDPSVKLVKFADDTTLIGLIQDGDESAHRQEVEEPAVWCSLNNLELNTFKTLEMIADFRRTLTKKRADKITLDPSHPAHSLFELLPSGRRYRALSTRTTRQKQFLSPRNPSHEHLTLNMEHTTLL